MQLHLPFDVLEIVSTACALEPQKHSCGPALALAADIAVVQTNLLDILFQSTFIFLPQSASDRTHPRVTVVVKAFLHLLIARREWCV